jgi:hypothetical protein
MNARDQLLGISPAFSRADFRRGLPCYGGGGGSSSQASTTSTTDNRIGADTGGVANRGDNNTISTITNDPAFIVNSLALLEKQAAGQSNNEAANLQALIAAASAASSANATTTAAAFKTAAASQQTGADLAAKTSTIVSDVAQAAIQNSTDLAANAFQTASQETANYINGANTLATNVTATGASLAQSVITANTGTTANVLSFLQNQEANFQANEAAALASNASLVDKQITAGNAIAADTASGGQTNQNQTILYVVIALAAAMVLPALFRK